MPTDVALREVRESDLPFFFEHQLDPEATRMAAFPPRTRDAFMAHWATILADATKFCRTIVFSGKVAGHVGSWADAGEQLVGYWIGREFWNQGVASAALSQFLDQIKLRPLTARVAKHNAASLRVLEKCGFTILGEDAFVGPDGGQCEELILRLNRMALPAEKT